MTRTARWARVAVASAVLAGACAEEPTREVELRVVDSDAPAVEPRLAAQSAQFERRVVRVTDRVQVAIGFGLFVTAIYLAGLIVRRKPRIGPMGIDSALHNVNVAAKREMELARRKARREAIGKGGKRKSGKRRRKRR